jgi:isopenicillin N synthase-like dioxygenase
LVDEIATACAEIGFFVITGHALDAEMHEVFDAAHQLFELEQPAKERLAMVDRQGFVPARHRVLDATIHSAPMEYYDVAISGPSPFPPPSTIVGFADVVRRYQQRVLATATDLLWLLAIGLELPPDFFAQRMRDPQCFLRMMHYEPRPPVDDSGEAPVLTDPHTDYGLITLLATDGVGGLEVQPLGGDWQRVVAPAGSLVVNLGDMLARWTNDHYVSTPHRVTAPVERDRFSVPFFVNPDRDTIVSCVPSCVDEARPCRYPPVTASEFLAQRIDQGGYMTDRNAS